MVKFREEKPIRRTDIYKYSDFHRYKPFLRVDFNKRCGYCNDLDIRNGGLRYYQIDHFVPQAVFKTLQDNDYHNLVYSCPYCNRAKWHKWPSKDETISRIGNEGFIDPCLDEYEKHIGRNADGTINTLSDLGKYIYKELDLNLRRHSIIWNIERLINLINETQIEFEKEKDPDIKGLLLDLYNEQQKFLSYLDEENDQ